MLSSKKQVRLSLIWVLVNFAGIAAGTLVAFFLYALLTLSTDNVALDSLKLLGRLAICGAAQGFIVAGLQTMVLVLTTCKLAKWWAANVVSMSVGMVMPTAFAVLIQPDFEVGAPFDHYVMSGWVLSWLLAGAFGGIVLGESTTQKIRWSLLNAAAYLYWGVAAALGMRLLSIALYDMPTLSSRWAGSCALIAVMLSVGAWLHSYVFRGVIRLRRR